MDFIFKRNVFIFFAKQKNTNFRKKNGIFFYKKIEKIFTRRIVFFKLVKKNPNFFSKIQKNQKQFCENQNRNSKKSKFQKKNF